MYGHSSSSGALRVKDEPDPIDRFEKKLRDLGILDAHQIEQIHDEAQAEVEAAIEQVLTEPTPEPGDVERYTYAPSTVDAVYPEDYTGPPQ
jgi:TPP-dependent pyruvate/acetoin dehydrogenase alpha subunit